MQLAPARRELVCNYADGFRLHLLEPKRLRGAGIDAAASLRTMRLPPGTPRMLPASSSPTLLRPGSAPPPRTPQLYHTLCQSLSTTRAARSDRPRRDYGPVRRGRLRSFAPRWHAPLFTSGIFHRSRFRQRRLARPRRRCNASCNTRSRRSLSAKIICSKNVTSMGPLEKKQFSTSFKHM